jgi:hypothetical protein
MILPIKSLLMKYTITGLIAPHGMTDYIHAFKNNTLLELNGLYALTTGSFVLLDQIDQSALINIIFIFSSIFHFQRDVPLEKKPQRCFIITMFFLFCFLVNNEFLLYYMSVVHVPNHYRINWDLMKKLPLQSIGLLSVSTFLIMVLGQQFYSEENMLMNDVLKGIVVSHILYEELYIFND